VTNVAAISTSGRTHHYIRVGNQVTVYGRTQVDATASSDTPTDFRITLPISSNFTGTADCYGHGGADESDSTRISFANVIGDTSNDAALISYRARNSAAQEFYYSFTYTVK
jgi:hypothetical protein